MPMSTVIICTTSSEATENYKLLLLIFSVNSSFGRLRNTV